MTALSSVEVGEPILNSPYDEPSPLAEYRLDSLEDTHEIVVLRVLPGVLAVFYRRALREAWDAT